MRGHRALVIIVPVPWCSITESRRGDSVRASFAKKRNSQFRLLPMREKLQTLMHFTMLLLASPNLPQGPVSLYLAAGLEQNARPGPSCGDGHDYKLLVGFCVFSEAIVSVEGPGGFQCDVVVHGFSAFLRSILKSILGSIPWSILCSILCYQSVAVGTL